MIGFRMQRKTARRIGAAITIAGVMLAVGIVPTIVLCIGAAVLYVSR